MPDSPIAAGSLVAYKSRPARVDSLAGDKLTLSLADGGSKRVRPKDVSFLHPGPVSDLRGLDQGGGEIEEAWEALAGESLTLADLAELAFGAFTPAAAWACWRAVLDGLLFEGEPDQLVARDPEAVAADRERRESRERAAAERRALLERLASGAMAPEDGPAVTEVERLALGRASGSALMRELGREETYQEAHRLLLENGRWDEFANPYPARYGAPEDSAAGEVPELPEEERTDLTHLDAWAIDDAGNTDPDDAVSLEGERVWVHVADVGALVPPGTALDAEARERGGTHYLPEGMRTMLPPALVDRLGLGLAETSPALSFGFRVTEDGELADIEVVRSRVRVTRLSYEAADERLEEPALAGLRAAAERFRQARLANGAISFQLPEVQVAVAGGEVSIRPVAELASRALVTETMIMAGYAAARFARERGIAIPFASQPAPDGEAEGEGLVWAYGMRRLMRPSRVQLAPEPHAGLGLSAYAQATSPLRRYFDLVAHQQLRAYLRGENPVDAEALAERTTGVGERMGALRRSERLANQHFKLVYLRRGGAWDGEGVVVERQGPKGRVLLPDLGMEATLVLPREAAVGDRVKLECQGVDLPNLEPHLRVQESA